MKASSTPSVRRVLIAVLVLNLGVALAKLLVGWWTNTISMVADAFHSLTDSASNIVGLVGISYAARPPDEDHPYGHQKSETLSALFIGALLALTAWEILRSCLQRLQSGGVPEVGRLSFIVMVVTLAINLGVSTWERRRGRELRSQILKADAAHTASDVYVSIGVLFSLAAAALGYPQMDLIAALVITVVIARAAFQIVRESAGSLMDAAVVAAEEVREVALTVPGVEGVHKVRTRGEPQDGHADLHIQVRPELTLDQAHVIGHLVTDRLREVFGFRDVVTHVEPADGHRTDWRPQDDTPADEPSGDNPS